jgi:hypothetical protein
MGQARALIRQFQLTLMVCGGRRKYALAEGSFSQILTRLQHQLTVTAPD